jgi:flagellar hook assembly protein FlgD
MANSPSGLGAFVIWDGTTTTGTKVPDGTYFYVFTYTTKTNETKTEKGTITLLR